MCAYFTQDARQNESLVMVLILAIFARMWLELFLRWMMWPMGFLFVLNHLYLCSSFSIVRKGFSGKPCNPLTSWYCLFSLYVHLIFLLQPIWGAGPTDADDLHHTVYSTGAHCRKWGPLGWEPAAPGTSPQTRGGPVDVNQGKKLQVLVLNQGEDL